jgi:hypothetical protein
VIEQFGVPEWYTDPRCLIAPGCESWSGFVAWVADAMKLVAERHHPANWSWRPGTPA